MTSPTWQPPSDFAVQCQDLYGLTCPPRWGTPRRPELPTLGGKAAKVMEQLGCPPMPHQRYVLDVGLEIDPVTGIFAYREVGLSIPRQQGKTETVLSVMVHRIIAWTRQNVLYTAQTRGMARQRWEDEFLVKLDLSKLAGRYRARKTNGNEAVIWSKTRSKLGITSNTEKAGHGPPLDLGVMDESFAHEDDRLEQAMKPAMATKEMAQLWWASAGGTEKSIWLNKKRERGRELIEALWLTGTHPGIAYFEWFAPDELDRNDPKTWHTCMPALGKTITEATIRADRDGMDDAEFDRAYLNRTRKHIPPPDPNVPSKEWPGLVDVKSKPGTDIAIALEISANRDSAAIGVAGLRADELMHLELIDLRDGTAGLVARLVALKARHNPVAVAVMPNCAILSELDQAGIKRPAKPDKPQRGDLWVPTWQEYATACARMTDLCRQGRVRHIDQRELNLAVAGAHTKPMGDAYGWARRNTEVNIVPWVAVTLACAAAETRTHLIEATRMPMVAFA